MKTIDLSPSRPLEGAITVPADKSITHRAIILSSLAEGTSRIINPLRGEDCLRTLDAFRMMGTRIDDRGGEIIVTGSGIDGLREPDNVIDCGNSGTTARLLCGVLSGQSFFTVLTGDDSLRNRPMERVTAPLSAMGARFFGRNGGTKLPMAVIGGRLKPLRYESPVASAQVKTAILLAGLFLDGVTEVIEPGGSRDHTERMLPAYGADLQVDGLKVRLKGRSMLKARDMTVPGDLSSAAFFIVAALTVPGSSVTVLNVGVNPTRTGILDILERMGARIALENLRTVSGEPVADLHVDHTALKGVDIGGDLVVRAIDEFPAICVAAAMAEGETRITGASELRVKESDRIAVMTEGLRAMGIAVEELPDGMVINGGGELKPGRFRSYGDHRIAMAMAIASLNAEGTSSIEGAECIDTSFPGFFETLAGLSQGED